MISHTSEEEDVEGEGVAEQVAFLDMAEEEHFAKAV